MATGDKITANFLNDFIQENNCNDFLIIPNLININELLYLFNTYLDKLLITSSGIMVISVDTSGNNNKIVVSNLTDSLYPYTIFGDETVNLNDDDVPK